MARAPSSDNVILGKGEVFFDRFNQASSPPTRTGFVHLGNCDTLEINTQDDVLKLNSSMDAGAGVYKQVTRKRDVTFNITGHEYSAPNLAQVLMGATGLTAQAGAAVSGEVLATAALVGATLPTSPVLGKYFRTAQREVSAVVVKSAASTLTLGTDYLIIDAELGIIQIILTSNLTASMDITVSYTSGAATDLETVDGGTDAIVEGALMFLPDPSVGPKWEVYVYRASFAPNGALGFIGDDWGRWSISGSAQNDAVGAFGGSTTSPYYRLTRRVA